MSTQYTDGSWSDIESLPKALETLHDACDAGVAKKFVIGTHKEIEKEQIKAAMEERVDELEKQVEMLTAKNSSPITIPTNQEVKEYSD